VSFFSIEVFYISVFEISEIKLSNGLIEIIRAEVIEIRSFVKLLLFSEFFLDTLTYLLDSCEELATDDEFLFESS
jgi:hypothetical protein